MYVCSATWVYVHQMHVVSMVAQRGQRIPWNWNHRQLGAIMWVLGSEPDSIAGTASALSH